MTNIEAQVTPRSADMTYDSRTAARALHIKSGRVAFGYDWPHSKKDHFVLDPLLIFDYLAEKLLPIIIALADATETKIEAMATKLHSPSSSRLEPQVPAPAVKAVEETMPVEEVLKERRSASQIHNTWRIPAR